MKSCNKCIEMKSLDEFNGDRATCRPCLAKIQRDWRAKNPKRSAEIEHKSWNEKQKYSKHGMTKESHAALALSQSNTCAICKRPPEEGPKKGLFVDHDHSCCPGQFSCGDCIRGLLCMRCNSAIGFLNDDPELVLAALMYLESSVPAIS